MFSLDSDKPEAKAKTPSNGNLEQEYIEPYSLWSNNQTPNQNDMIIGKISPIIDTALKSYVGQDVSPSIRLQARRMALEGLKATTLLSLS